MDDAAQSYIKLLQSDLFRTTALEQGLATEADLVAMELELQRWGESLDAFEVSLWRTTVGWKTAA